MKLEKASLNEDDLLKEAKVRLKESESGMEHIIESALDDITIVDGENQWDKTVKQFREDHGLVMITENLLPSFIDQVEGDFRQNKPQVDCIGVDDKSDPETARILAGMIRSIDYQSQADMIYSEAALMVFASSFGCWRIHTQYEDPMSFNQEIIVRPIENHLSLRWDLTCKKFDTSDKKFAFISEIMPRPKFEEKYGKDAIIPLNTVKGTEMEGWYLDKGVRIAEYWFIDEKDTDICLLSDRTVCKKNESQRIISENAMSGKIIRVIDERKTQIPTVYTGIISGEKFLEGPFEWPGKYIPIPIAFGKRLRLDGKMKLKSLIRDAKESQRMHNYLISTMVQGVAMQQKAQYIGTNKQFEGKKAEWQAGIDGDVPFLTYNFDPQYANPPKRERPPEVYQGYAQLLMQNRATRQDIIGMHDANLGAKSNETSGIAIRARQHEGDVGSFVFLDNFRHALEFDARIKIDLIPKIYDTPRMQRIIGIDGKESFVQLYEQGYDDSGRPVLKANPKVGKYDVRVTTGPSFTTQREQTRDSMVQLVQASGPQSPATQVIMPGIIKSLDWQDGDKIAQALIAMLPQNIQHILTDESKGEDPKVKQMQMMVQQQVAQMQAQMQEAMQQAQEEIQKLQQDNIQLKAGVQVKLAEIEANKALSATEAQIQREKIMADMSMHEKELEQKKEIAIEEMKSKMATELTIAAEKMKMEEKLSKENPEAKNASSKKKRE